MSHVYSVPTKEVHLDIEAEDDDTILMRIVFDDGNGGGSSESVRVDPADLARELITTSPGFALAIGELVQSAVFKYLRDDDAVEDGDQAVLA